MDDARDGATLLRRFFDDVLNRRGREVVERLVERSFTDHDPLPTQEGGLDGLLAALACLYEGLPDYRYEPLLVICEDSRVAARWRMTGTHTGPLFGRPPTGKAVEVTGIDVLGVGDGRVKERWSKWERHVLLGVAPSSSPSGG